MNNPYLDEIARAEKKPSGNRYLDEIEAKEKPSLKGPVGKQPKPLPGSLGGFAPADPFTATVKQNGMAVPPSQVQDIRQTAQNVAMLGAPGIPIIGGSKAAGTPKKPIKTPSEVLGLPNPNYQAPVAKPQPKLTREQVLARDPGNKPAQMVKDARAESKKAAINAKTVKLKSPFGDIEVTSSSVGLKATIPGVGTVQAPNQETLKVKINDAITAKLSENEMFRLDPRSTRSTQGFEDIPDENRRPEVVGNDRNVPFGRNMSDKEQYQRIADGIKAFGTDLIEPILKATSPQGFVIDALKKAGLPVPKDIEDIAMLPIEMGSQYAAEAIASPIYVQNKLGVLVSPEWTPAEKAETALGLTVQVLLASAVPFGPSAVDYLAGKLGGEGFEAALKALESQAGKPVREEVEKVLAQFQPKELEGYTSPATLQETGIKPTVQTKAPKPKPLTQEPKQTVSAPDKPKLQEEPVAKSPRGAETPAKTQDVVPPREGQALTNRVTDILKKRIGEPEYAGTPKETVKQWVEGAVKKGYHEPERAQQIAREVIEGTRKSLDKEETVGLASALDDLDKQWDDVSRKLEAKAEKGGDIELSDRLDDIRQKIVDISEAGNRAGAEWGRSGVARQVLMKSDGSFAGIIARRQKIVKRELTSAEVAAAKKEANELAKIREAQDARIRQLEDQLAQRQLTGHTGGSKPTREKAAKVEAKIKDVSERLKVKWAQSKPTTTVRSSALFGADVAAEQVVRVAKIAPEILELAKLHAEKGLIKLADNTSAVVKHLKGLGINDIEENDVAAVLAGRIKGEGVDRAKSTYESLRQEASATFKKAAQERVEQRKFIAQREAEIKKQAQSAQRAKDEALLKAEKDQLIAEERAARQAERDFWKEVRQAQRADDLVKQRAATLTRKESVRRWRASVQGKRAATLNRLDELQKKLDFFHENDALLGAKSDLPEKPDDILLNLRVKEASLKRQMSQIEHKMRQAEAAKNKTTVEKLIDLPTHQIPGTLRNLLAMGDMSWSGIQGALTFFLNPKAWGKGFLAGGRNLFAKNKAFVEAMEKLRENDFIDKIIASGVDLPGIQPGHADEFFADTFADNLWVYGNIRKGSQQAYDAASTVTRVSLIEHWIKALESAGRPLDGDALKVLGEAANTLTGKASGKGGQMVASWPAAGKTLFAPSWWLSQFQGMTGKPLRDALIYGAKTKDWRLAKLMTKEYAKITVFAYGSLVATAEILKRAKDAGITDWEIETNIQSKDFGKVWTERGGKRISVDFLPPQLSAPVKFGAQAVLGTKDDDGKVKGGRFNRQILLGSTFEGKYGPGFRIGTGVLDSMYASDNPNKKTGLPKYPYGTNLDPRTGGGAKNLALQSLPPIAWQQAYKGVTESNLSASEKAILFFLSAVGRGPNIYEKPKN